MHSNPLSYVVHC